MSNPPQCTASWNNAASASERHRASERSRIAKEYKRSIDAVVVRGLREVERGHARTVDGVSVVKLAVPDWIATVASKDPVLVRRKIVVQRDVPTRPSFFAKRIDSVSA